MGRALVAVYVRRDDRGNNGSNTIHVTGLRPELAGHTMEHAESALRENDFHLGDVTTILRADMEKEGDECPGT